MHKIKNNHERMEKGDPIRFVKGKYAGLIGWKNKAKKKVRRSPYVPIIVLVEKKKDGQEKLKATRVKRSSYRQRYDDPTSKEEAAIQQHPDLELAMITLARIWAEMGTLDNNNIVKLFNAELKEAQEHQRKLGPKARYRFVEYPCKRRRDDADFMSIDS